MKSLVLFNSDSGLGLRVKKRRFKRGIGKELKHMQKIPRSIKAGLDTEHFDIIHVMSLGHFYPVIVMRDKRAEARDLWCLQYRGSGYYFKTLRDMTSYCTKRNWQNPLSS